MSLRNFIKDQIKNNNVDWESKSALIRSAGETVNGHSNRVLREYENEFNFGISLEIKNKEIKKYFEAQPKNSLKRLDLLSFSNMLYYNIIQIRRNNHENSLCI